MGCLVFLSSLSVQCEENSDVGDDEFGGVNIKVFRGPNSVSRGGEMFAPFGYYVKMPVAAPGPYNKGPEEEGAQEEEEEEGFDFSEEQDEF